MTASASSGPPAVSRQYTHLTTDDKRAAIQRLPDVTKRTRSELGEYLRTGRIVKMEKGPPRKHLRLKPGGLGG
jgi:hypothetical protein